MNRFIIAASALMITTGLGVAADLPYRAACEAPGGMGQVDAQVRDIFRRYPTGGPGMISAIRFLLADDHVCRCPGIAGAVVDAARRGTVEQKIAAGQALADAQTALALNPNTLACANTIGNAAGAADPQTMAAYRTEIENATASEGGVGGVAAGGLGGGGIGGAGSGLSSAVGGGLVSQN